MTKVYAVYSIYSYESTILKGIFLNKEDAKELAKVLEDTSSCDYTRIEEATTKYPHCDMYLVSVDGFDGDISDSYKLTVEEAKRTEGKVKSFAIRN